MKARRYIFGAALVTGFAIAASGQNVNTSITPGSAPVIICATLPLRMYINRKPSFRKKSRYLISYIREADVMWAKDVWRTIDLRHRHEYAPALPP